MPTDPESCQCGWVKLYHPRGALVTLPVTAVPLDYAAILANVSGMLDAGFLVTAPGLEEGEQREDVGWVVRRTVSSRGGTCPRVYLYLNNDGFTRSHVSHYLNTPEDIAAFEFASGMKIDQIPAWPADAAPERGKPGEGEKFIVKAPRPFGVIFKLNPEYKEGDKDKTKRLFVRWADERPAAAQPQAGAASGASGEPPKKAVDYSAVDRWREYSASDPPLADFNRRIKQTFPDMAPDVKAQAWEIVKDHAKQAGWIWSKEANAFFVQEQRQAANGKR